MKIEIYITYLQKSRTSKQVVTENLPKTKKKKTNETKQKQNKFIHPLIRMSRLYLL